MTIHRVCSTLVTAGPAHQAGLLDHYDRVQDQEANLRQAREWAWAAHRYAIWALASSGIGILLAAAALLTQ